MGNTVIEKNATFAKNKAVQKKATAKAHTGVVSKHIIPRPTACTEKMLKVSALDKS